MTKTELIVHSGMSNLVFFDMTVLNRTAVDTDDQIREFLVDEYIL